MSHRLLLFSFLFFISFASFSQAKQRKADLHYSKLEYYSAAPIYAELAEKAIYKKGKFDWENVRKAAYSYKAIFQFNSAKYYFSKLHETNRLTELDYVEYIDLLRTVGNYETADLLLTDAMGVYPQNNFVQLLKDKNSKFDFLLTDSATYYINALSINSDVGDFCPAFYEKGIIYMSKAKNAGFLNTRYGWDNSFFINMLYSEYDADSSLTSGKVVKDEFFSRAHDGPVSFSPDGTKMVITKNTLEKSKGNEIVVLALYFSEKLNGEWTDLKAFPYNNKTYNVGHACFSSDGKRIYFASDQPGGLGGADLYYSDFVNGNWTSPTSLGTNVNTDQDDLFPYVTEKSLYFSSKGHFGIGGLDVFYTDLSLNGKINNLGYPINTSFDDFGIIAFPDGKNGFLSSNRGDFIDRIYEWERKDPLIFFEGTLYAEYEPAEIIPNHWVVMKDETDGRIDTLQVDSLGHFASQLTFKHIYSFQSEKEFFKLKDPLFIQTANCTKDSTFRGDVFLIPTTIMVSLKVVEKGTNKSIPYAKTTIRGLSAVLDTTLTTDKDGLVTIRVDRNSDYAVQATKRGYMDDNTQFQTDNYGDKVIQLTLQLPLIKKGDKFKLENIFYDYNKYTLRPESTASLDRLAEFIIENKLRVELSSHTDARGKGPSNQKLSQNRAQSCVDYLIKKGVPTAWIVAKGYGEEQLINKCKDGVICTEEEHQANRRTEIKIL
jgi:outer membrane protein OmpA-like peptidoglycan-associated protein